MWCVYRGKIHIMVLDTLRNKYIFIPEKKWDSMTEEMKARYIP